METMTIHEPKPAWYPANLQRIARRFEGMAPQEALRWGLVSGGEDAALATGFGPSGVALMHMAAQLRRETAVFYLQTDLLFPETLALRDELAARLGLRFIEVPASLTLAEQQAQYGAELWRRSPDLCCRLRKVQPLRRFLRHKKVWITGIRRDQSPTRAHVRVVDWDYANQLIKICPLAAWTRDEVWDYVHRHNLPYNPLHDQGYPSIGCMPCTRPAAATDDERAGRWAGSSKIECGIHVQPDGKVVRLSQQAKV